LQVDNIEEGDNVARLGKIITRGEYEIFISLLFEEKITSIFANKRQKWIKNFLK